MLTEKILAMIANYALSIESNNNIDGISSQFNTFGTQENWWGPTQFHLLLFTFSTSVYDNLEAADLICFLVLDLVKLRPGNCRNTFPIKKIAQRSLSSSITFFSMNLKFQKLSPSLRLNPLLIGSWRSSMPNSLPS